MNRDNDPRRIDVRRFAELGSTASGSEAISSFKRLSEEVVPDVDTRISWEARGESRADRHGSASPWLRLHAAGRVSVICQRCLQPMEEYLEVDRWFRFASNEQLAAAEDQDAEEDVLVGGREFDLLELVEDELLMALPLAPRHAICPVPIILSAKDQDFDTEDAKPHPFAALRPQKEGK